MNPVILYKQDNGAVAVVHPTEEALALYGIEAIAKKDVPAGKPYKITDASEVPADRKTRDTWQVAESELIDGVGADSHEFEKASI